MRTERVSLAVKPSAYWMPQDDTLLLNRDVAASGLHERIAPAAQAMLERQDLLKDLRLVLGSLAGHPQPTHSQVEEALGRAEIDGFDVANIQSQCGIGVLRNRIRPVLKLRGVSDDGLDDATDTSGLTEWLSKNAKNPRVVHRGPDGCGARVLRRLRDGIQGM